MNEPAARGLPNVQARVHYVLTVNDGQDWT